MAYPVVTIGGTPYIKFKGSLWINNRIEERSIASFSIPDADHAYYFRRGQPVSVTYNASLNFGGVIDTPDKTLIAPDGSIIHGLQCADWHYLADKRLAAVSYVNQACGYIVRDLLTTYLADEGVTEGEIQDGPTIKECVLSYCTLAAALDGLKAKAGFTWWIDSDKKLYFVDRATNVAPWAITRSDIIKDSAKWSGGNPKYRNVQYIRGGKGLTSLQTETRYGDGVAQSFVMGFPLAQVPTVTVGGVAKTLGIKGLDTGKDFYWSKGDAVVFAEVAPADASTIVIAYYGQYDIMVKSTDDSQIAAQQAIEGAGTGQVEDIIDDGTISSLDGAFELAAANLSEYCRDAEQFLFDTYRTGLQIGQLATITHLPLGLDTEEMLISAVTVLLKGQVITYKVTAVKGPVLGSWTKLFKKFSEGKSIDSLFIGTSSSLTVVSNWSETTDCGETIVETVYACSVPDSTLYPSATLYPC